MIKSHFAIRWPGGKTEICHDGWAVVGPKVTGKKDVTFKGFGSRVAAEEWLEKPKIKRRQKNTPFKSEEIYIFVDGSYSSKRGISGWGWVAVRDDTKISEGNGVLDNIHGSRNIVGELWATRQAVEWVRSMGFRKVIIVHDYAGIGNWALGFWKAKSQVAIEYVKHITPYISRFGFEKCYGHSGIKWNDYVDELTRKGYPD